jgi:Asp-tRNA(Asn)/Glu-tRNA(Gln) amidotransferase A subunit family amidase
MALESEAPAHGRRKVLKTLLAGGAAGAVFARALTALAAAPGKISAEMVKQAEWIAGLTLTDAERDLMLADLVETQGLLETLRAVDVPNDVPPAVQFRPLARAPLPAPVKPWVPDRRPSRMPASDEDLAYGSAVELSYLVRKKQISPVELARLSLERIQLLDSRLSAVITRTATLAFEQARAAEAAAKRGNAGPLAGLPWGAKDLLAVPGYPTTWGSRIYASRQFPDVTAAVAEKITAAGGALIAKTAVGELAWGDVWFGGTTKNPWKLDQGASGSSAGSAAGVAAGYFPFAIGTETWGSIVSPATRCGVTGLRPTFGRVSRHGVMSLSWSMDKVGVLARSAEDCALVFSVIQGADPRDPAAENQPFQWPPEREFKELRVGFAEKLFEAGPVEPAVSDPAENARRQRDRDQLQFDQAVLDVLRRMEMDLRNVELRQKVPTKALSCILSAEAATAFTGLLRAGRLGEMTRQTADAWPNVFRQGHLVTAVDYLRAQRVRTLLMRDLEDRLSGVDLLVAPSFGGDLLLLTNLTGHPAVILPNGFHADGTPGSITLIGKLHGEADLLQAAMAYQEATPFHKRRPRLG